MTVNICKWYVVHDNKDSTSERQLFFLIYKCDTIPIKYHQNICWKNNKVYLKCIWKKKTAKKLGNAKNIKLIIRGEQAHYVSYFEASPMVPLNEWHTDESQNIRYRNRQIY